MKKNHVLHLFFIITLAITTPLAADDFDDLLNDPEVTDIVDSSEFNLVRSVSDKDVADALIDLGALAILQENIYLRTNPFNKRRLVDSPLFLTQREHYNHCWIFGGHLFFNFTGREFFDEDSSNISSYLAIRESDLLDKLNASEIKNIFTNFNVDPVSILPLFYNMTVQERKFGVMLHAEKKSERTAFSFMIPFYYLERNFFLTETEQEAIEQQLGKASNEDTELFARNHLISDALGFGDSRLTVDVAIFDRENFHERFGIQGTFPTAFAVADGLLGTTFAVDPCRPEFSFSKLFDLGNGDLNSKAMAELLAQQFTMCSLDALARNLLETDLGNGRHVGIGAYLLTHAELCNFIKRPWAEKFFFKNKLSLDYYFPARSYRNYIEINDLAGFESLGLLQDVATIKAKIAADPAYAAQVVAFLEQQFVDRLFPFPFKTKVCPGMIFHSTSKFVYESGRAGFHIGGDTWVQSQEKLRDISIVPAGENRPSNIDVAAATRPLAYQGKLIGAIYYKVIRPQREWTLAFNADATLLSSGIGKDFTLSLNFEVNF